MSWAEDIEDLTREGHPDQLLTKAQAAALLGVGERRVYRWGHEGRLPRVVLSPKVIRYRESDVRRLIRDAMASAFYGKDR